LSSIKAIIGITPVTNFLSPIIGIPDDGNATPHSYLFMPPKKEWPDMFVERMTQLLRDNE